MIKAAAKKKRTTIQNPIVPAGGVTSKALVVVIAIMTFLACLALGSVNLVSQSAGNWESQIAREATIQIKPNDNANMDALLQQAVTIVKKYAGIKDAQIIDLAASERLLEPWLGSGLDMSDLPIPRLIIVTLDGRVTPDFAAISNDIKTNIPGGSFDDHRTYIDRLVTMAHASVLIGLVIFILVLSALVLTVVFATHGALAGNAHIVEVLHFIGADTRFIARQFDKHFLTTGLRGALYGGLCSVLIFLIFSWWSNHNIGTPEADQAAALLGNFAIGLTTYGEIIILIVFVGFLTMITSRLTVMRILRELGRNRRNLF